MNRSIGLIIILVICFCFFTSCTENRNSSYPVINTASEQKCDIYKEKIKKALIDTPILNYPNDTISGDTFDVYVPEILVENGQLIELEVLYPSPDVWIFKNSQSSNYSKRTTLEFDEIWIELLIPQDQGSLSKAIDRKYGYTASDTDRGKIYNYKNSECYVVFIKHGNLDDVGDYDDKCEITFILDQKYRVTVYYSGGKEDTLQEDVMHRIIDRITFTKISGLIVPSDE